MTPPTCVTPGREPIRVLIADDHPFCRYGVRMLLDAQEDMEAVGEAQTGAEAIALAEHTQPDLILMDINMPGVNGIEATRRILAANPRLRILMMTMREDDEAVFAALRAGASGYLLKGADLDDLLRAIRAVHRGEAIFGPGVAQRVLHFFATSPRLLPQVFPALSEREHAILDLMARGQGNAAIAHRLDLSEKTVRNYVSSIFAKLQVADRAQAVVRAWEAGLGGERPLMASA